MVYVIEKKYYVLISGYYKEVKVIRDGVKYAIKRIYNSKNIIARSVSGASQVTLEQAYKASKKNIEE